MQRNNDTEDIKEIEEFEDVSIPMQESLRENFEGFVDIDGLLQDPMGEDELKTCVIDPGARYKRKEWLIAQGDAAKGALPKGDISLIKAKPKEGKSTFATIMSAIACGARFGALIPAQAPCGTLYVDTEQQEADAQRITLRTYAMNNWDIKEQHGFHVASLRDTPTPRKLPCIIRLMATYKPDLLVIDGIADLITDFNSIEQSQNVIDALMRLTAKTNCHIINVLHQNKGENDSNAKGHLGSLLTQKASEIYNVQHDTRSGTYTATCERSRNMPIDPVSWRIDEDGNVKPCDTQRKTNAGEPTAGMGRKTLTRKELAKTLAKKHNTSERTAYRMIEKMIQSGQAYENNGKITFTN